MLWVVCMCEWAKCSAATKRGQKVIQTIPCRQQKRTTANEEKQHKSRSAAAERDRARAKRSAFCAVQKMKNPKCRPNNGINYSSDSEINSRCHKKACTMFAYSHSSWWRRIISVGVLLQILVNCGKFNHTFSPRHSDFAGRFCPGLGSVISHLQWWNRPRCRWSATSKKIKMNENVVTE